jgi:hypothetical protein
MIRRVNGRSVKALAALALTVTACTPPTDTETALRDWVADGERAIESEDRRALMAMVSPAYADARGNSRDDIDRLLRLLFLRQDGITVVTRIEDIVVNDDTAADISLTAAVAGGNEAAFLGFDADALRFRFELVDDDGDWVVTSARWGELGEAPR